MTYAGCTNFFEGEKITCPSKSRNVALFELEAIRRSLMGGRLQSIPTAPIFFQGEAEHLEKKLDLNNIGSFKTLGVDRLAPESGSTRLTERVRFRNFIFLKKGFMISNFTESDLIATLSSNRVKIFL